MGWLASAIGFVLLLGMMGITIRLALRDLHWSFIFVWTAAVYVVVASALIGTGQLQISLSPRGVILALVSGLGASLSFILLNMALDKADASLVVPVTSAYPIVTAVLSVLILRESFTMGRAVGTVLVVSGLVILARSQ